MTAPDFSSADRTRITLIASSFQSLLGYPLVGGEGDIVRQLWQAPMAIVAHDIQRDPVFFFGNAQALALFEMSFADFARLPSRLSADAELQGERSAALAAALKRGYIANYSGVRISARGRRFRISDATLWNISDAEGNTIGQAAAFAHWTMLD